jgi:DNA-binding MarR family transcriptional regulator
MKELKQIVEKLSGMMGQMEENAKEQYNFSELTLTQMNYMEVINYLGNPNLTELATALRLSKPTVTVAVEKLIEKDYLFKVKSDADRRSQHIHLTEKGQSINGMHDFAHGKIVEYISRNLNDKELNELVRLLGKVVK